MKTVEMADDVWLELEQRAKGDVVLRGLLRLMREKPQRAAEQSTQAPTGSNGDTLFSQARGVEARINGRQLGKRVRHEYARKHGMIPCGGVVYATNDKEAIMPFATERNPDHWFLGAPVTDFAEGKKQCLVLLCWKDDKVLDFVFPPKEVRQIIPRLTHNSSHQFMFNVARRSSSHYELQIPNSAGKDITRFLGADAVFSQNAE
ncbi:MAG: hypothetical protein ABSG14_06085 [Verrucomicrobiia bacterium]|jgi:hypothetical protein